MARRSAPLAAAIKLRLPAWLGGPEQPTNKQIPQAVVDDVIAQLPGHDQQQGALTTIDAIEWWLRANQLHIVKEHPCVSQLPELGEPSAGT